MLLYAFLFARMIAAEFCTLTERSEVSLDTDVNMAAENLFQKKFQMLQFVHLFVSFHNKLAWIQIANLHIGNHHKFACANEAL